MKPYRSVDLQEQGWASPALPVELGVLERVGVKPYRSVDLQEQGWASPALPVELGVL